MLTIRATPVVIVPAVANKIIFPLVVYSNTPDVTTARSGSYDVQLRYQLSSTSLRSVTGDIARIVTIGSTFGDRSSVNYPVTYAQNNLLSAFVNKPLVLHNVDGGEYGAGSTDNILTVNVSYFLADA